MEKRKIKSSAVSVTGRTFSEKSNETVSYESTLERDFYTILEFDNKVKVYTEQLVRVEFTSNGRSRLYTPDVFVEFHQGSPWLCEVKYRDDLRENFSEYKSKFKAAKQLCKKNDWKFVLITESIRDDYLKNAKFLLRFRGMDPNYEEEADIIQLLASISVDGLFTITEFKKSYGRTFDVKARGLSLFWRLVYQEYILFDTSEVLSVNTEFWLNEKYYGGND
jgi:hypothetical protein